MVTALSFCFSDFLRISAFSKYTQNYNTSTKKHEAKFTHLKIKYDYIKIRKVAIMWVSKFKLCELCSKYVSFKV